MADLSQYSKDMSYLKEKAEKGDLRSDNTIYKNLKQKSKNLENLKKWFEKEIDPHVKWV